MNFPPLPCCEEEPLSDEDSLSLFVAQFGSIIAGVTAGRCPASHT
jgi:hypothetical protein